MEDQYPSGSSSAANPRWVMLEQYLEITKLADSSYSPTNGEDPKTLAAARTRTCYTIQVSLGLLEPPALSRVLVRIPDGLIQERSKVLAAHGDSVLIQVYINDKKNQQYDTCEHFVYNAGDHDAEPPRPPSLSLLPPYYEQRYFSGLDPTDLVPREHIDGSTGLLRRGDDELVVAEFSTFSCKTPTVAELYLFRSGEWKRKNIKINEAWDLDCAWWDTVVPVGDRLLCWVDLRLGVVLIDVFKKRPTAQYVRLAMDPHDSKGLNRNVCTTAGGGSLKFVNTWTMRIGNGDMELVKDDTVDATELWALDAYEGLPCDPLDGPIVSIIEPEVICFRLRRAKCRSRMSTGLSQGYYGRIF